MTNIMVIYLCPIPSTTCTVQIVQYYCYLFMTNTKYKLYSINIAILLLFIYLFIICTQNSTVRKRFRIYGDSSLFIHNTKVQRDWKSLAKHKINTNHKISLLL